MKTIQTQEKFESVISAERALVFIYFAWSAPARMSEIMLEEYEKEWAARHPELKVCIYKIEPDEHVSANGHTSFMNAWLLEVKETGGFGSLVWVKDGQVAGYERHVARISIDELADKTKQIYGERQ